MMLLGLHEQFLLYFGSIPTVLTTDPSTETCGLSSVFGAHSRGGLSCVVLRH